MKYLCWLLVVSCGLFFSIFGYLYAEENEEEGRLFEAEKIQALESTVQFPAQQKEDKLDVKFGGWFNYTFRGYRNVDNNKEIVDEVHRSHVYDLRLWMNISFDRNTLAYIRLKNFYIRRATDNVYTGIGNDFDLGELDSAFFQYSNKHSQLRLGRQYLYLGRGIVYSKIHDGIKYLWYGSNSFFKAFLAHTRPHEENIDMSVDNYEKKGRKLFAGLEFSYLGIPKHIFYGYFLSEYDRERNYSIEPKGRYAYDAYYFGAGAEGVYKKSVRYWTELIHQIGNSRTDGSVQGFSSEKKDIDAWAFDLGARYTKDILTHPFVELEYSYGSGDKDRSSVTDTEGTGNLLGDDKNFLYFGSFFSGYASSLRLSNLNVFKYEAGCKPLEQYDFGKKITLGAKFFYYKKSSPSGGIYDDDATEGNSDVGKEINTYLFWQFNDKTYWFMRYGVFFPGAAYPAVNDDETHYFASSLTIKF